MWGGELFLKVFSSYWRICCLHSLPAWKQRCVNEMRTFFFLFFLKLQWRVFQSRFPYPLSPWVGWLVVSNITFSCSYLSEAPDVMTTACLNVRKLLSGHCFWRVSKSPASFDWMVFLPISSITPRLSFKP